MKETWDQWPQPEVLDEQLPRTTGPPLSAANRLFVPRHASPLRPLSPPAAMYDRLLAQEPGRLATAPALDAEREWIYHRPYPRHLSGIRLGEWCTALGRIWIEGGHPVDRGESAGTGVARRAPPPEAGGYHRARRSPRVVVVRLDRSADWVSGAQRAKLARRSRTALDDWLIRCPNAACGPRCLS